MDKEAQVRKYPCDMCGKLRSKDEGGTVFTVCDECWDKSYPKSSKGKQECDAISYLEGYQEGKKVGEKLGTKKVVDWLRNIVYKESHLKNFPTTRAYYISDEALEDQLKEWNEEDTIKEVKDENIT